MFYQIKSLPDFYAETEKNKGITNYNSYALPVQLEFLESRRKNELDCNKVDTKVLLLDRCIYEDYHIFAMAQKHLGFLTDKEFEEYELVYKENIKQARPPDLFVYLKTSQMELSRRIKSRGRDFEQSIDKKYLDTLNYCYNKFFDRLKTQFKDAKIIVVETDGLDANEVYQKVLDHIPK